MTEDEISKGQQCVFHYYHLRDYKRRPMATVCLAQKCNGDGKIHLARGVSVCGEQDQPVKKEGINRARGRAIKALEKGESSEPMARQYVFDLFYKQLLEPATTMYLTMCFKSEFEPKLYPHEEKMLQKREA